MASTSTGTTKSRGTAAMESETIRGSFLDTHGVITTTMNDLPGFRIKKVLGTTYGLVVRSRNWAAGLLSVAKSVVGGELKFLTNLLYNARQDAAERAIGECMGRGGNALIALRFDVANNSGFAEVCCYGTACIVEEIVPEK